MSCDQRRCGRETRWRERKRKAGGSRKRKRKTGGSRKRKGFPLQSPPSTGSPTEHLRLPSTDSGGGELEAIIASSMACSAGVRPWKQKAPSCQSGHGTLGRGWRGGVWGWDEAGPTCAAGFVGNIKSDVNKVIESIYKQISQFL